jgi:hypothetical protein
LEETKQINTCSKRPIILVKMGFFITTILWVKTEAKIVIKPEMNWLFTTQIRHIWSIGKTKVECKKNPRHFENLSDRGFFIIVN